MMHPSSTRKPSPPSAEMGMKARASWVRMACARMPTRTATAVPDSTTHHACQASPSMTFTMVCGRQETWVG